MTKPNVDEFFPRRNQRHTMKHPDGWEPGLQWDGKKGLITTGPMVAEPDPSIWARLIEDWGLDPTATEVVDGSLQIRAWQVNVGDGQIETLKYYKCAIKPRELTGDRVDIESLCKEVMKRKPAKPNVTVESERAFVITLADWQLGKGENGGTEATTERILASRDRCLARYHELVKVGRAPSVVYIIGVGDLSEGCQGFYPMMEYQIDLNRREQERLARRLIVQFIDPFAELGLKVVAMGVPGNHGENRKNGKAFTDFTDNSDVSVFESVAEIFEANPERYGNVSIPLGAINNDDLTMTLDICGVPTAFAHGHQYRGGTNAAAKAEGWWKGQALGRTDVSDAEILISGHYHHFVTSESTGRTFFQCPAMDGGSKWFTGSSGQSSPAGMLTMCIGAGVGPRGWSDLLIL